MRAVSWSEADADSASFLAIVPPEPVADTIRQVQAEFGIEGTVPPHITIKAQPGLQHPEVWRTPVRELLAQTPTFELRVGQTGWFGGEILYLTVDGDDVIRLHRRILACLGASGVEERFEYEAEEFVPHLTVGDPWAGTDNDLKEVAARFDTIALPAFQVDEITEFHRSEPGATYARTDAFRLMPHPSGPNLDRTGPGSSRAGVRAPQEVLDLGGLEELLADVEHDEPGIVLGIALDGHLIWSHARGRCSPGERASPLSEATTFYVASLAKQVTAACVALLAESGLVDLVAEVRNYLPELPSTFDRIQVTDLIHHVSGIPSLEEEAHRLGWAEEWWLGLGTWDMVELIAHAHEPPAPAGTRYRYANEGYLLLAAIIERASSTSVDAFASSQIFEPLGMSRTWYRDRPESAVPAAMGHSLTETGMKADRSAFHFVGDGGLVTSVADLAVWAGVHAQPFLLGRPLAHMLTTRGRLRDGREVHYAWGLSVRPHHGRLIHSHGGQFVGNLAKFVQMPGQPATTFIALANRDDLDVDQIALDAIEKVMHDSLDLSMPSWRETLRADGLAWASPSIGAP